VTEPCSSVGIEGADLLRERTVDQNFFEFAPFRSENQVDFAVLSKVIVLFLCFLYRSHTERRPVFLALRYKASLFFISTRRGLVSHGNLL